MPWDREFEYPHPARLTALGQLLQNLLKHLGRIILTTPRSPGFAGQRYLVGHQREPQHAARHRIEFAGIQNDFAIRIDCIGHCSFPLKPARLLMRPHLATPLSSRRDGDHRSHTPKRKTRRRILASAISSN